MRTCVISACPDTYSGYGKRSFDFIKELIRTKPDWDIKILSQRWGDTRMGYLQDHNETELISRIVPRIEIKPDIWIQITVPNEFQAVGRYNIGMTAAMETNLCDVSWVQGCNRMDLVLVSSKHGKTSLTNSAYINDSTGEEIRVKTPIEVLFEGVDLDRFYKLDSTEKSNILQDVTTDWNYLCVGHWMQGDFGQDRKNIGYTVKMFLETFKDKEKAPGLILKTCKATSSIMDRYEILDRLYAIRESVDFKESLPKIYLLHGDLTDEDMNLLYNDPKVKALVSLTKGEGFGRPFIEFAAIGKPILCSGWSGHLDFLDKDCSAFVGGKITKVHSSAVVPHMILPEALWFTPDNEIVKLGFEEVYSNYDKWKKLAKKQAKMINTNWTIEKMGQTFDKILKQNMPVIPEQINIKLPND